jgi:hypothetical protein
MPSTESVTHHRKFFEVHSLALLLTTFVIKHCFAAFNNFAHFAEQLTPDIVLSGFAVRTRRTLTD